MAERAGHRADDDADLRCFRANDRPARLHAWHQPRESDQERRRRNAYERSSHERVELPVDGGFVLAQVVERLAIDDDVAGDERTPRVPARREAFA